MNYFSFDDFIKTTAVNLIGGRANNERTKILDENKLYKISESRMCEYKNRCQIIIKIITGIILFAYFMYCSIINECLSISYVFLALLAACSMGYTFIGSILGSIISELYYTNNRIMKIELKERAKYEKR